MTFVLPALVALSLFLLILAAVLTGRRIDRKAVPVPEMKRSWLVQRLHKPRQVFGVDNPFSFGGGLRNGGLSPDAMALVRGIFSFDYMGAAEFEWGEVPKALGALAKSRPLAAGMFRIALADVAAPIHDRQRPDPEAERTIYWLAPSCQAAEIQARIRTWAKEGYRAELKEPTYLDRALRPADDFDRGTVGWLELDNGFLFFTDREMFTQSCTLFGIDATQAVA